jgi:CubicO group peptidase (beta-lactamase class C family)
VFGSASVGFGQVDLEGLLSLNDPDNQRVGLPGGGGIMRAADLALFYQRVLHDDGEIWSPAVLGDATGNVRNRLPDRLSGTPANRTLGLVQAGADGLGHLRSMGRTVSPRTVGHTGARGQLAWGDPVSGLSLGYCTNGLDRHVLREARRNTAIASLAGSIHR